MTFSLTFRARKPGIVSVLVALLVLSFGLRVGVAATTDPDLHGAPADDHAEAPPEAGAQCTEPAMAAMLDELLARERVLRDAEAKTALRESEIAAAEARLAAGLQTMAEAEARLEGTLAALSDAQQGDIDGLVATYEAMKPDQAAKLFAAMAPDFAAEFIRRMKPDAAAPILAGLDPQQAYALSVLMAGHSASRIERAAQTTPVSDAPAAETDQ
jgi:flagellar motility protein MotE (MotC chaperone)